MKLLKNLMLFALIASVNLTALSQTTNIPSINGISKAQKIEVVSTLETYPIVLRELDLYYELLNRCEDIKDLYYQQVKKCDEQLMKLEAINANKDEQIDLLKTQLKKKKSGCWLVPVLVGLVGGTVLGVSL